MRWWLGVLGAMGAACVEPEPAAEGLATECGPGTVEEAGECVAEAPDPCAPGSAARAGACVALDPAEVLLPFPEGVTVGVSQGSHGAFSHRGTAANAVDFPVPEGTLVVAARAGRVLEVREDSDSGCGDPSCSPDANFVVIDHGDATFGMYWHLSRDGALVAPGDVVARGQPIGLSGNTGFTTGPHLHFQIRDPFGQSLPLLFADQPEGVVYAGGRFVSGNAEEAPPAEVPWSTCPTDLFSFLGVELDPGVPCAHVQAGGVDRVSGRAFAGAAGAVAATVGEGVDGIGVACGAGERFDLDLDWGALGYDGAAWLAVAAADRSCTPYQAWDVAVQLVVGP